MYTYIRLVTQPFFLLFIFYLYNLLTDCSVLLSLYKCLPLLCKPSHSLYVHAHCAWHNEDKSLETHLQVILYSDRAACQ